MNLRAVITPNTARVGLPIRLRITDEDCEPCSDGWVFMSLTVHRKEDAIAWLDRVREASGETITVECTV